MAVHDAKGNRADDASQWNSLQASSVQIHCSQQQQATKGTIFTQIQASPNVDHGLHPAPIFCLCQSFCSNGNTRNRLQQPLALSQTYCIPTCISTSARSWGTNLWALLYIGRKDYALCKCCTTSQSLFTFTHVHHWIQAQEFSKISQIAESKLVLFHHYYDLNFYFCIKFYCDQGGTI